LDYTTDRGHGRIEERALKAVSVKGFGFPHAAQVIQATRTGKSGRQPLSIAGGRPTP
jgi:hypothetical protein